MSGHENGVSIEGASADQVTRLLTELDEADFERVAAPTSVWDAIEAVVSSARARKVEQPHDPPGLVVEYWIDAHDVISDVGRGWAEFAHDNGAPSLAVPAPDRTLWTYFDDPGIRDLWQLVVAHVRTTRAAVQVPIRCDAPRFRRWFTLAVTPEIDGRVHFRSTLEFEEPRTPVALLDPESERDDSAPPIPVCSWCGRGRLGSHWLDVEELVSTGRLLERTSMPPVAHGLCAGCRDDMSSELFVTGRARDAAN